MRRLVLAVFVIGQLALAPAQVDRAGVALADLGRAIASGQIDNFKRLASPSLPPADAAVVEREFLPGAAPAAILRERARAVTGDAIDVLADVFIRRGRIARVATWRITLGATGPSSEHSIVGLQEQASFDGLVKLALDESRQFAVHNLTVRATDLTMTFGSGVAYAAIVDGGTTALVIQGHGSLDFTPPAESEQAQLRVLGRQPFLKTAVDTIFLRVNPAEFSGLVADSSLVPEAVRPEDLLKARDTFARFGPQSFVVDLQDMGESGWSLIPGRRNLTLEFKSDRFGWLTYSRSPTEPEDISLFHRDSQRLLSLYASPEKLADRGVRYDEDAGRPYDIQHYGLDLTIDPDRRFVSGRASISLRMIADRQTILAFRLDEGLNVSSVGIRGFGRVLSLRAVGQGKFLVSLPGAVAAGTDLSLNIAYSGRLNPLPFDREALTLDASADAAQQQSPPTTVEAFQPEPEPLLIYSGRLAWYPQAAFNDYAPADLRLTVPADVGLWASGAFVRSTPIPVDLAKAPSARPMRVVEYTADKPTRYLSCVLGKLQPASKGRATLAKGDVAIDVMATPRQVAPNKALAATVASMMQYYATTIGDAPYPSMTVVAADDNIPGGHSPAYGTIIRQALTTTPFDWRTDVVAFTDTPNFLLAHEVAHQWWGQAVGWRNYHEQWLSEGLAQYFAALYIGSSQGDDAMRRLLAKMRASAIAAAPRGPISLGFRLGHVESDGRAFRTIVYNKSAIVLHMLRGLVGDDAFFKALRRFYRERQFQKAGTDDLRAAFEAESPIKLGRFFDRWLTTTGLPRAQLSSRLDADGRGAAIHLEQIGPAYEFPLTFGVEYTDGHTETLTVPITDGVFDRHVTFASKVRRITVRDEFALVVLQ